MKLQPNPWVSWRTYNVSESESRTLILNQKEQEYSLLEGLSSAYWAALCEGDFSSEAIANILELPEDEVIGFADELASDGLINLTDADHPCFDVDGECLDVDRANRFSSDLEREMMAWTEEHCYIYAAHWELTYRCNEICVHCYNPGAAHEKGEVPARSTSELSTEEAKNLLDELVKLGVFRLTLSGGEPTLRRDFVELLAYARRLGFQVVIYTNGLKIGQQKLEQITQLFPSAVEISIYSANPNEHDAVTRVPGSFERSMDTIGFLRKNGVSTVFKTSLTSQTINNWESTLDLGERNSDKVILSTMIAPGVDGKKSPLNTAAEFRQLVILAATPGSPIFVGGSSDNWGRNTVPASSQKPCGAGHGSIAITPEGKIYPCISFPMEIGDFRAAGLKGLKRLASDKISTSTNASTQTHQKLLEEWRGIRMEDLTDCGKHERCHFCGDLCPGDGFVQTGDYLQAAENHCRQAYARMTASSYLQSGKTLDKLLEIFNTPSNALSKGIPPMELIPHRNIS